MSIKTNSVELLSDIVLWGGDTPIPSSSEVSVRGIIKPKVLLVADNAGDAPNASVGWSNTGGTIHKTPTVAIINLNNGGYQSTSDQGTGLLVLRDATYIDIREEDTRWYPDAVPFASNAVTVCITGGMGSSYGGTTLRTVPAGFFIGPKFNLPKKRVGLVLETINKFQSLQTDTYTWKHVHESTFHAPNCDEGKFVLDGDFHLSPTCNIYDTEGNAVVRNGKRV